MALSQSRRKLLGRLRRRKDREREGLFLVEGVRTAVEALEGGGRVVFAVISPRLRERDAGEILAARLAATAEVHEVADEDLAHLSDTESPQGVLLVCEEPRLGLESLAPGEGGETPPSGQPPLRILVVDGVQDPGNLGTLVRAAAAFALAGVVVLEGTVDPYNPKAVRGAAGGIFRLPLVRTPWDQTRAWLGERGVRVLVSDASGRDVGLIDATPPWALVVGSEAAGARDEVRAAARELVAVPMPGGTESLNAGVAGAVLLYALTQRGSGA